MHEIFCRSTGLNTKPRNGDQADHLDLADDGLVVLVVADGVGAHSHDWAASEATCRVLLESFGAGGGPDVDFRMVRAVEAAHDAVQSLSGEAAGALSTLVLAVWRRDSEEVRFISVGDSRIYRIGAGGAEALTEDDSRSVVVRRDGDVVLQAGAVAFSHALTRALGQAEPLDLKVRNASLGPGEMLALASDGCYELPGFGQRLVEIQKHLELAAAADTLIYDHHDVYGADDASLILLRRTAGPGDLDERCQVALETSVSPVDAGLPGHLVARRLVAWMGAWAAEPAVERVDGALAYLKAHGLCPGRAAALAVLGALRDDGQAATLDLHRRLTAWAATL